MNLTYAKYLHLDQLLTLQQPRSQPAEHDEMIFIITHQTYELWFKLLLHELEKVRADLFAGSLYPALSTLKRCRTIMKVLVEQIDILETLTPRSFSSFRARLEDASGFQSAQFRELEYLLGYKRPELLKYQEAGTPAYATLEKRLREPTIMNALYGFLYVQGVTIPKELQEVSTQATEPNTEVQAGILELYRTQPNMEILFELLTDFDEGFQEWRYRHIKLVERTIGRKHGTGGSLGVDFLKQSLFRPLFPDLWAIRHQL
jgi:tryptophan 2,3-dioxygenase